MRLCYEGVPDDDIADRMFLSIHTINNHRRNCFKKLGLHSMAEFNRYAAEKGLFKATI